MKRREPHCFPSEMKRGKPHCFPSEMKRGELTVNRQNRPQLLMEDDADKPKNRNLQIQWLFATSCILFFLEIKKKNIFTP